MNPEKMNRVGMTDLKIPQFGIGTNPLGGMFEAISPEDAQFTIKTAYENGVKFFDTAPVYGYGNSERAVGAVLRNIPREDYILTTKVGRLLRKSGPAECEDTMVLIDGEQLYKGTDDVKPYFDFSYDGVMKSIEDSQKRTGIERFDALHIHDPDWFPEEAIEGAFKALEQLKREGTIGAVGCGMNQWELLAKFAREGNFDMFLLAGRYTLLDQSALAELLPLCVEHNISIINGGVYNSGILCHPNPAEALKVSDSMDAVASWKDNVTFNYVPAEESTVKKVLEIMAVCKQYDVPLKAAAVQFSLGHPAIASVIVGPRNAEQVIDSLEMFRFDIPSAFWADLKNKKLIPESAPTP